MFRVTVEEDFSAGHALRGYRGKCENLHGHNYKVQITVEGAQLDPIGLLCDFLHLKQIIRGIVQGLDHQFLNDLPAFSHVNPSAENLAKHFYEEASKQVAALPASARIAGITVWETDVTSATYTPE